MSKGQNLCRAGKMLLETMLPPGNKAIFPDRYIKMLLYYYALQVYRELMRVKLVYNLMDYFSLLFYE